MIDHSPLHRNGIIRAFSMIELMVVMVIFSLALALSVPVVSKLKSAGDMTTSVYQLAGTLDQARTYAMAHNTYVWVGFFEEDGGRSSQTPAVAGSGRLVIGVVASRDGTRYGEGSTADFGSGDPGNAVGLMPICKLIKAENIHIAALNVGSNEPARPATQPEYQVGSDSFAGSAAPKFTWPITQGGSSGAVQYTFAKIIEFNPRGEASKIGENVFSGPGPADVMEIACVPTHGSTIDPVYAGLDKAAAAIQLDGFSGNVRVYRP